MTKNAPMAKITIVYTTVASLKDAKKIGVQLVDTKVAGCVVWLPVASTYNWKGQREVAKEYVLLCKTTIRGASVLRKKIVAIHPYETPCILSFSVDANSPYAAWLTSNTR